MILKADIQFQKINFAFEDLASANIKAARNTLNIMAALTRRNYIKNVKGEMILRNTFTTRNIRFDKTDTDNISTMQSSVGATEKADYMKVHEESGIRKPKRGTTLAIAQIPARQGSYRRPVARSYYIRKMRNKKTKGGYRKKFNSEKAKNVARAYVAYQQKRFYRHGDNIYLVHSFRKTKQGIRFKKTHLYNLSQKSVFIPQTKMLLPATEKPIQDSQRIYNSQMNKLLK